MMLTRSDLEATVGRGQTVREAAATLRCATKTIIRTARVFNIDLPGRPARVARGPNMTGSKADYSVPPRVSSEVEWRALYDQYGPSVRAVARALSMDHQYVRRTLRKHGIISDHDEWVAKQEEAA